MINYAYTILYVEDVEKSLRFYETAFQFQRVFMTEEKDYGELASGQTKIAFASIDLANSNLKNGFTPSQPGQVPFGIELGLTTDNVQKTCDQAIAAGAHLLEAPITKAWGQVVAYIQDPNGFLLEICTPMS
ncbi:MAG: VOC family protein [Bacteroidota bacterium]